VLQRSHTEVPQAGQIAVDPVTFRRGKETGRGFSPSAGVTQCRQFTVNVAEFEVPPPGVGLTTVTVRVPGNSMS
jgi:hypothetical protein